MAAQTTLTQSAYRFINDDGSESAASFAAALNTGIALAAAVTKRIRIQVTAAGGTGKSLHPQFQYNHDSAGWNDITTTSSKVKAVDSTHITNGEATTERLAGSGTFLAGEVTEDGLGSSVEHITGNDSENELVFQLVAADLLSGGSIQIRILNTAGGNAALDSYTQMPTITVTPPGSRGKFQATLGVG